MARIDTLPSLEIIRGFKGILDFYLWRGLPCVRAWPRYRPAKQSAASLAAALTFGAIVKAYSRMGEIALQAYRDDAKDQPRTARDIYITSQYGHLHEASMTDFLDAIIIIRDAVVALTDLLHALDSVSTDEIDVNVEHSVLPDDAATHTRQLTMVAALNKIDDLQDALESKALDRLLVRGMDQLQSFESPKGIRTTAVISGANGYIDSGTPAAGKAYHLTSIIAQDRTSPCTELQLQNTHGVNNPMFHHEVRAFAINDRTQWQGHQWLAPGDTIRAYFVGAQAGDTCRVEITGLQFTLET